MTGAETISPHLRIFGAAVLLMFVGWVVRLVRAERLTLRDSLLWLLSTLVALVTVAFPQLLFLTARVLGVQIPSNALFVLAILYLLLNLFSVTVAVSFVSARTRRLTQECALLRAEIDLLRGTAGSGISRPADA
jgi:hypothetical protein